MQKRELKPIPDIKYIVMEDGTKHNLDMVSHVFIMVDKIEGNEADCNLSFKCLKKNNEEHQALSNNCFLMSYALNLLSKNPDMSFEEACRIYDEYILSSRKELKNMKKDKKHPNDSKNDLN